MHASLQYLGRGGAKVYLSSKTGSQFAFLLFDLKNGGLLSVMGADLLGRYRTGAASAVATKHLSGLREFILGVAGSGRQGVTQVLAMSEVAKLEEVRVWSPVQAHRNSFAKLIGREYGIDSTPSDSVEEAFSGAQVATTITSSRTPFVVEKDLADIRHMNVCGSNWASRAEVEPRGIALFDTVCVDDVAQSRIESGDLIIAAREGHFDWNNAVELRDVVQAKVKPGPRTLFKSNGVAVEDVALGSLLYDRALKRGDLTDFDFLGDLRSGRIILKGNTESATKKRGAASW
jgi:ornithine cyclodeaminase/alanine dehydrogenase-like protein (mu-crystallin family)